MTSPAGPTGRRETRDGSTYLVFERTFRAPIDDVWAAATESGRLGRWLGVWAGDPASGSVMFRMTAESVDAPEELIVIDECVAPTRLVLRSPVPGKEDQLWAWQLDLAETDGVTTLTFAQEIVGVDAEFAESIGGGWDYYLDRMVAAETGQDLAAIDFADYHPAYVEHYRAELA